MARNNFARNVAKKIFGLRIPANAVHRLLALEYQLRHFTFDELRRIFYYQPMFESQCHSVGSATRLELMPDSKVPPVINVELELGERVRVNARTTFSGARNAPTKPRISIGDDTYVGGRVVMRAGTEIVIGNHVLIASNALISGDPGHPFDAVARRTEAAPAETLCRIEIGDDAWLAYNVTVLGNVKIGEGAVIAAGAVVTKDVPPYTVVAGNPAKVIRTLPGHGTEILNFPTVSVPNHVKIGNADRAQMRQALKEYYVGLFSNASGSAPDEASMEAVVDRAIEELEGGKKSPQTTEQSLKATALAGTSGSSDSVGG